MSSDFFWIERDLIKSKAFRSLKTSTAHLVLMVFLTKRQFEKKKRYSTKDYRFKNNGEIVFTYAEAKRDYGIAESRFQRAIDELCEVGFLDIAQSGQGTYKIVNLYALPDRWRKYGQPDYEPPKPKKKGPINRGFQPGNQFGRNCGKSKATVINGHESLLPVNMTREGYSTGYVDG